MTEHRSEFKKGIDVMEGRRRRTETSIKLRKDKKEEGIAKRRAMNAPATSASTSTTTALPTNIECSNSGEDIPSLMTALSQPGIDDATLLETVRGFRKLLSVEVDPPVNEVLTLGPFQVFLTISLDNLVPLDASPVGDPLLDDVERERSDPGRGDTAIYRRCMARNRSGLLGRP